MLDLGTILGLLLILLLCAVALRRISRTGLLRIVFFIVVISLFCAFMYLFIQHVGQSYSEAKTTSSAFLKSFPAGDLRGAAAYTASGVALSEEELETIYKEAHLLKKGEYQAFDAVDSNSVIPGTIRIKGFIADSANPIDVRFVYIRCRRTTPESPFFVDMIEIGSKNLCPAGNRDPEPYVRPHTDEFNNKP